MTGHFSNARSMSSLYCVSARFLAPRFQRRMSLVWEARAETDRGGGPGPNSHTRVWACVERAHNDGDVVTAGDAG